MRPATENPLLGRSRERGPLLIDGGLASELERRGEGLDDPLWSARVLLESPELIREVHLDYLRAGAGCLIGASYQASFPGLLARGLGDEEAASLLRLSVELAEQARAIHLAEAEAETPPLVAASIGPYGAYLADGSEYTGSYRVGAAELFEFHERRWRVLAETGADLLACETLPSRTEAELLLRLLKETPDRWAWLSFSCRDGKRINDGTPLREVALLCDAVPRVAAIGINCTAPAFVSSLIGEIRAFSDKPVVVYPNAGEHYDAGSKTWSEGEGLPNWAERAVEWRALGATGIGGCCRVGPEAIAAMARGLEIA